MQKYAIKTDDFFFQLQTYNMQYYNKKTSIQITPSAKSQIKHSNALNLQCCYMVR